MAFELVKTLGYLKWQRVIHSDLKPENILVSTRLDDIGMDAGQVGDRALDWFAPIRLVLQVEGRGMGSWRYSGARL